MLPLWIIDLNRSESAQDKFREHIHSLPGADERWRYTTYSDIDFDSDVWFSDFVQELVSSGQNALRDLKSVKPINDCCMNICVLGDATEEFTLKFFSTVAAIIKKEKCRIIPGHIHQGINILGMLYVPSDIHNKDFTMRQNVLRCLKELDVQHRVNLAAGYDRVMLYQDTQRRTAKLYPLLTAEQRLDYLLQCIIHLYYICDSTHPLLDSNGGNEDFFFSMGVGSLYYDTNEQDAKDVRIVGNSIFDTIKERGLEDSRDHDISIFDIRNISTNKLFDVLQVNYQGSPSESTLGVPLPSKHPIEDFKDKHLLRVFYYQYLKTYPTKLLDKIIEKIADSTKNLLEDINVRMQNYYVQMESMLRDNFKNMFKYKISPEVGCLVLMKNKIREFKESITRLRSSVDEDAEVILWNDIIENRVPKRLHDAFLDYHRCFKYDEQNTSSTSCDEKKAELTEKLTGLLKYESTLLSTLLRSFLAGVILVLAFMPIIEAISPSLINLGDVKSYAFIWATFLFLVPLIVKYIGFVIHNKKKHRIINQLIACYLHDSYARLVNRAKNQVYDFYDKMTSLSDEYDKRCDAIINVPQMLDEHNVYTLELPKTMFNQPVIDGECCGIPLFPDSEINRNLLSIRGSVVRVDNVNKKQQYAVIQDFPDLFMSLFKDVKAVERVYRNPSTREITSLTDEDIAKARDAAWEQTRLDFHKEFAESIKTIFIPRADTTIAQKLNLLAARPENKRGFEVFSAFCESNGEFTANDDTEFADIKTNNRAMRDAFKQHLPLYTTVCQVNTDDMYRSSLFLTRWRTYNHICPGRVLPEIELFDRDIFSKWNKPPKSSLILYALIGDMSPEWNDLFTHNALIEMPDAAKEYKDEIERRK